MRNPTYSDGTRSRRGDARIDLQVIDEHRLNGGTVHLSCRTRT